MQSQPLSFPTAIDALFFPQNLNFFCYSRFHTQNQCLSLWKFGTATHEKNCSLHCFIGAYNTCYSRRFSICYVTNLIMENRAHQLCNIALRHEVILARYLNIKTANKREKRSGPSATKVCAWKKSDLNIVFVCAYINPEGTCWSRSCKSHRQQGQSPQGQPSLHCFSTPAIWTFL